jgi:hypothetical protein
MFTLEQQIFIVQYFFSDRERLGPIRHLEFLKTCFWKQVVFCAKKAVDDRQKDQLKILKRVNKQLLQRSTIDILILILLMDGALLAKQAILCSKFT